ncbi:MAG: hypothetical protein R2716_01675 [Microthrixaceae bacterium]
MEWIRTQLRERFGAAARTGARVYDLRSRVAGPRWRRWTRRSTNRAAPLASLVSIDEFGRVRAMVAGDDFESNKVNLALGAEGGGSGRPAGSTFKPFALAAFVDQGYSIESRFQAPGYELPGCVLLARRALEAGELRRVLLWRADGRGGHVAFDQHRVRRDRRHDQATARPKWPSASASESPGAQLLAGAGLGEVSVLDMASAYSTFAARGRHTEPYVITRVEDAAGNVLFDIGDEVVSASG